MFNYDILSKKYICKSSVLICEIHVVLFYIINHNYHAMSKLTILTAELFRSTIMTMVYSVHLQ